MTRPASGSQRSLPGTSRNPIDQAFFLDAARGGMGNIMLSQLALQKATSPEAKRFAQAELDEQNQVKADLTRIAPQLGLALPSDPMPKQRAAHGATQPSCRAIDSTKPIWMRVALTLTWRMQPCSSEKLPLVKTLT